MAPYQMMKEKELARDGDRFIAEGENVVRRLLRSKLAVESVLVAERKLKTIAPLVGDGVPLLSAPDEIISRVIGFDFHSGVLACGIRPNAPPLQSVIPPNPLPALAVVCQGISNTENLGALIRVAAAFGANALILGELCCDPFFRQSVRVSMGTVFSIPIVRSKNLIEDLNWLNESRCESYAAILSNDAKPLQTIRAGPRVAIAFGNEAQGLDEQTIQHCRHRVTIPMQLQTDSLNVAMAAAVFLYHMTLLK